MPDVGRPEHPDSYYSVSDRLAREIPGAWKPDQYHNPDNPAAQYETTGPEIWEQTAGRITHFVAGVGTGGTITGIGRYLKEQNPDVRIDRRRPRGLGVLGRHRPAVPRRGHRRGLLADTYDPSVVDEVIRSATPTSFATARRVTREEGLLIGGSGGTAVAGRPEGRRAGPRRRGRRAHPRLRAAATCRSSTTTGGWPTTASSRAAGPTVGDLLRQAPTPAALVHTHPDETVRQAIEILREFEVSQVPVVKARAAGGCGRGGRRGATGASCCRPPSPTRSASTGRSAR